MCLQLEIKCYFSLLVHLQDNGQVEAANKVIKYYLKTRLNDYEGAQVDELLGMFQAYKTTPHSAIRETPYLLAFEAEVVVPIEVGLSSH